jgi:hypothetical protein
MSYRRLARFNRKAPTSVKPAYLIFNPHSLQPCIGLPSGNIITTTIDPGIKNCAIRCAEYDVTTCRSRTLVLTNINFTAAAHSANSIDAISGMDTSYYSAIFSALEPYTKYFQESHYIGVESQLAINYDLVRMGQHIITYIMTLVRDKGNRPYIMEIDSHLKTRMLHAPPKMTKPQRKKWAADYAINYLELYDQEPQIANYIRSQGKKDDYGDVVCYEKVIIIILSQGIAKLPIPTPLPQEIKVEVKKSRFNVKS